MKWPDSQCLNLSIAPINRYEAELSSLAMFFADDVIRRLITGWRVGFGSSGTSCETDVEKNVTGSILI